MLYPMLVLAASDSYLQQPFSLETTQSHSRRVPCRDCIWLAADNDENIRELFSCIANVICTDQTACVPD